MGIPLKKYCENKVSAENLSNKRKNVFRKPHKLWKFINLKWG